MVQRFEWQRTKAVIIIAIYSLSKRISMSVALRCWVHDSNSRFGLGVLDCCLMTIRMLLKLGHQRIIDKRYEQQQERNITGKPTSPSLMQADIPMIKSLNWHQAKDWWSSLETTPHLPYPQLWTNWFWGGILLQVPNRRSLLAALIPFWEHLHQDNHSSTIQLGLWGTWTIWYWRICTFVESVHLGNWKTDSTNVHLTTTDCSGSSRS